MKKPRIDEQAVVADGAVVLGDVTIEKDVSIWYNAVIRGDVNSISIGEGTNIQDLAVLHVDADASLAIGKNVTIGHGAILHGCTIKDQALIGMGAIVLDNAVVESNTIVAAGSVVTKGTVVESGWVYGGIPAKKIKQMGEELLKGEVERIVNAYSMYAGWYDEDQTAEQK